MLRVFRHYIPKTLILLGITETLILLVSIYLGATFALATGAFGEAGRRAANNLPLWSQAAVFCAAMLLGMVAMGLYQRDQRDGPMATLMRLCLSFLCGFAVMGVIYRAAPDLVVGGRVFAVALLCSFIGIATCRFLCAPLTSRDMVRRVLVLGVGERAKQIENLRRASDRLGITIAGFVDLGVDTPLISEEKIIRRDSRLRHLAEKLAIDEIVVALDDRRQGLPLDEVIECKMYGYRILEVPAFYERQLGKIRLDALHPSNVIFADGFTQAILKKTEKRILDIVLSLIMLLLSLPIMLITAVAILLESGAPVLYRQERVGHRGEPFVLFKFRSMGTDAEDNGAVWARNYDDRVTRVGGIIRKFRIDELPQLFNVLKGDMSFVGPRPERPEFVAELVAAIPYYDLRHYIKPGITGWAQVSYPYGASIKDAREKLQYDLYYLKNYTIFLDLNILLQTIQVILWGKGAR